MSKAKIIGIIFLLFMVIVYLRKMTVKEDINARGIITYGQIEDLRKASWFSKNSVSHFIYFIDGKRYYEPFGNFPPDSIFKKVKIGSYYQVKYLPEDPEKCLMLFDKPVIDTMQFVKRSIIPKNSENE